MRERYDALRDAGALCMTKYDRNMRQSDFRDDFLQIRVHSILIHKTDLVQSLEGLPSRQRDESEIGGVWSFEREMGEGGKGVEEREMVADVVGSEGEVGNGREVLVVVARRPHHGNDVEMLDVGLHERERDGAQGMPVEESVGELEPEERGRGSPEQRFEELRREGP